MKATLSFVPPGGGEVDYESEFELPGVPQQGDYISVMNPSEPGSRDFIVKRTWWGLKFSDREDQPGTVRKLVVECEFALSGDSSKSHKEACEGYRRIGRPLKDLTKAAIDPREDRGGEDRVGVARANSLLAPVLLRAPPLPLLGVQNLGYDDAKPYGGVTRMKVRHAAVGMALALATLIVAHDLGIF